MVSASHLRDNIHRLMQLLNFETIKFKVQFLSFSFDIILLCNVILHDVFRIKPDAFIRWEPIRFDQAFWTSVLVVLEGFSQTKQIVLMVFVFWDQTLHLKRGL